MQPTVIDIYRGNDIQDPQELWDFGIRGVIHKASEGVSFKDTAYARRREWMTPFGFLWGAYHFARSGNVHAQVDNFLEVAKPDANTLLSLDWENPPNGGTMEAEEAREFLIRLMNATKRNPSQIWIYGGNVLKEQIRSDRDIEFFGQFRLWLCHYGVSRPVLPRAWSKYDLWQYSDQNSPPGAGSKIDYNVAGGTETELKKMWAPGAASKSGKQPTERGGFWKWFWSH